MKIESLSGKKLYEAFTAGAQQVIRNKDGLNKMNVFPVPDSDTGSNLAVTLDSIIRNTRVSVSAGTTMQSMAEQALMSARGNSGIIFAQFLCGLSDYLRDTKEITIEAFSLAARNAYKKAYNAINKPVEGTMLTVMREWAESLTSVGEKIGDFTKLFSHSLKVALDSLKRTPEKLKVLHDAHVVDAGAKGFVHFIQGTLSFFNTGKKETIVEAAPAEDLDTAHEEGLFEEELKYRYCTEAVLRTGNLDHFAFQEGEDLFSQMRKELDAFGDSLIVAGTRDFVRIHIHSNRPDEVVDSLRKYGDILEQKADDMLRQYETRYARKQSIALVTDSSCDLPQEILDQYQIHMVPLNLKVDGTEYLDKITIKPEQFYRVLDETETYPSSAQPTIRNFTSLYSFLTEHYDSVISVHLASALSGTWNMARQAAEAIDGGKISVIDSHTLSGSLGLLVLRIAEAIDDGQSNEELVRSIEEWKEKASILVSVQTLDYMVRGGRVSPLKGKIAKLMNLKPIVSIDKEGKSILIGKAFSRKANRRKIIDMVKNQMAEGKIKYYALVHAHAREIAEDFEKRLSPLIAKKAEYIMDISPVVGLNAGKGAVAVITMKE